MTLFNTKDISINKGASIILGNFDGVHLAHQRIFEIAKQRAKQMQLKSLAFTFNPHPQSFFGNKQFKSITVAKEKRWLISQLGIDYIVEYPFDDELTKMEPKRFFEGVLIEKLNAKVITVGENHRFGKERQGNGVLLAEMCKKYNIGLNIIPNIILDEEAISSTAIRKFLAENKLGKASKMLGRPYFIMDNVIKGKALGRSIGFPTINFKAEMTKLYPPGGVYVTQTIVENKKYKSVTNVGNKPTVGGTEINIETHLLGFDGDVYDKSATVFFYKQIRGEKRFDTIQTLGNQIAADIKSTYNFFNDAGGVIHD